LEDLWVKMKKGEIIQVFKKLFDTLFSSYFKKKNSFKVSVV